MVKINVEEILEKQNKTKSWLCDKMDIKLYNLNKCIRNENTSISFRYINDFCKYLKCDFNELFTYIEDEK